MSSDPFLKIDLLKKRRGDNDTFQTYFKSEKVVFRKGFLIGISFLAIVLLISAYILLLQKKYENEKRKLQSDVDKYDLLVSKINRDVVLFRATKKFNKDLALSVAGLKSGSAMLSEISTIIPTNIELSDLSVEDSNIIIKGKVFYVGGLSTINSFILKLKESVFFNEKNIFLKEVDTSMNASKAENFSEVKVPNQVFLNFKIEAGLNLKLKEINKIKLIELGSHGLAKRIDILTKAGLIE